MILDRRHDRQDVDVDGIYEAEQEVIAQRTRQDFTKTEMIAQNDSSSTRFHATLDVEEQTVTSTLIPQNDGLPDLDYPPTKCCCCCCDVTEHSVMPALPSCIPFLFKKRMGNAYVCFSATDKKHDGLETIYCMVPMCWPMLLFTYTLISAITVPILWLTIDIVHPLWAGVELLSTIVLYGALALTSFRDFGVFPRYTKRPRADQVPASVSTIDPAHWRLCHATGSYRPPGVVYCDMSGVLVDEVDHFCPWTGTTIAKKNLKTFYIFVVGLFVQIAVLTASIIIMIRHKS